MRSNSWYLGIVSLGLTLVQAEVLLISGIWVISSRIEIQELTRNQVAELEENPNESGIHGMGTLPLEPAPNETINMPKFKIPPEVGGRRFQIGSALCIVWVIVGLKIIFCCTIVLTHEPKPKPLIINHKPLRIQQCPVGNLKIRRVDGNLVHLPEEEEEEEEEMHQRSKDRSGEVTPMGQASTTPPPPYSSLTINF